MMGRPRKHFLTDEVHQLLADHSIPLHQIVEHTGIPKVILTRWSTELKINRHRTWTDSEEKFLREYASINTAAEIAEKLHRSEGAIKSKCVQMRISRASSALDNEGYTVSSIAIGLNCSEAMVRQWIDRGWLRGEKRGTGRGVWCFSESALRRFLREHTEAIEWKHMPELSKLWINDFLPKKKQGKAS